MAVSLKVCECCGHPLPTLEVQLALTRVQRAIFEVIQRAGKAGITLELLLDRVYRSRPDGGPLTALNGLCVQRSKMKSKLAEFGMMISTTGGHGSVWRLEKLSQTERTETTHATA